MRSFLISMLLVAGWQVLAEEKTCVVSGMHCAGCTQMVEGKLCDENKYSSCTVTITDEAKQLGQVVLTTKDTKAKVDEKAVNAVIVDSGYKMLSCKAGSAKPAAKKG